MLIGQRTIRPAGLRRTTSHCGPSWLAFILWCDDAPSGDSDTLRSVAVDNNATDEILLLLDDLPEGRQFETVEEVWEAVH